MKTRKITLVLAAASIVTLGVSVVVPTLASRNDDAKFFDPLFVNGKACAPVQSGVPPLLRKLMLAKTALWARCGQLQGFDQGCSDGSGETLSPQKGGRT